MQRVAILILAVVLVPALLALGSGRSATAQDTSAVAFPIAPDPALCRVEPRSIASLEQLVGTPVASPVQGAGGMASPTAFVPPTGEPADEEVIAAVAAFAAEIFACYNAGDYPRAFALQTDAYLARSFAETPPTEEDLAFLTASPVPAPPAAWIEVLALRDVVVLPDGRIGAYLDVAYPNGYRETQYGILVQLDEGFLLDEVPYFAPLDGTPTP